jgi:hypothetical protein
VIAEDKAEEILFKFICSIKNLRRNLPTELTSKKMIDTANKIKRTSYLAELEFKFCIALNCKNYPTQESSPIFNVILDYIELFYDKADVICDILPYVSIL